VESPPAARGFRMPAEWEPHEATWIAWPHEISDWPGKFAPIPWVYGEVVRQLARGERVRILVRDAKHEAQAKALLRRVGAEIGKVDFYRVRTDRTWTRDYCPLFLRDAAGSTGIAAFRFNGWAKYPNHRQDAAVPERLAKVLGFPRWVPEARGRHVVLEGGSIDVNGKGTLLTTEECLLSDVQARNPGLPREELEEVLAGHLGARKVVWLGEGIVGADTHGHVDDLARFVDARTAVVAQVDDPSDENYGRLRENKTRLERASDQDGKPLRVVPLPMPAPLHFDGRRLPASYANFYIGNEAVLVPTFNDPADRRALGILAELFPGRRVVGIHAVDLVWGLGTLHCMTQQQPAAAVIGRAVPF
jgi:agmatine deiminase